MKTKPQPWFVVVRRVSHLVVLLALASPLAVAAESLTVTVGPQYRAGRLHSVMMGRSYRALWTTPITVDVLDLGDEAGGLSPIRRVGGRETKGLALRGGGRSYTFRSIDKDPTELVPEGLRHTFVAYLVQDQMAAQHPAAALIVDELARAADVATMPIRFVVMPGDTVLAGFRKEFAGLVGTFAEFPTTATPSQPGFDRVLEIIDPMTLFSRLAASPADRVNGREYLKARLFDVLISDFDRHRKQWRWARRAGDPLWYPIPEDRDQAFARYEGLLVRSVTGSLPHICSFGSKYDPISRLTWNGREQDRWLLSEMPRDAWIETARWMQARMSDEVIERAARRMPREWFALDGARLVKAMKDRRDALIEEADRFYRFLAVQVDIQGTDEPELVRVLGLEDGGVEVTVARRAGADSAIAPHFRRRFVPGETKELRVYLRGGDDRVESVGRHGPIQLRIVGGPGDDVLEDSGSVGIRFYDSEGENRVAAGTGATYDRRPYAPPPGPDAAPWIPPPDWGRGESVRPWLASNSDLGMFAGGSISATTYGFRKQPFSSRHTFRAGWAFRPDRPHLEYDGWIRESNSSLVHLLASYSGLEVLNYHGFGNETRTAANEDLNEVDQREFTVSAATVLPPHGTFGLTLAAGLRHVTTRKGDRLIDLEAPYGSGSFGELGAWARLCRDTRHGRTGQAPDPAADRESRRVGFPTGGALLEAIGGVVPKEWNVDRPYGWLEGHATTYATGGRVTFAFRGSIRQMVGDRYPYFAAASLAAGGLTPDAASVRGITPNRFIGDRSVYFNGDSRMDLSGSVPILPCPWGLLGFADAGRVWLSRESSNLWHTSWGAGPWIGLPSRSNPIVLTVARSDERTAYYLRTGFSF